LLKGRECVPIARSPFDSRKEENTIRSFRPSRGARPEVGRNLSVLLAGLRLVLTAQGVFRQTEWRPVPGFVLCVQGGGGFGQRLHGLEGARPYGVMQRRSVRV